jgi:hypothetical protein
MHRKFPLKGVLAVALCLVAATASHAQTPQKGAGGAWTGRWHVGSADVCRSKQRAQGLFVYTAGSVQAYEGRCDIRKVTPRGAGFDLLQSCRAEGETWTETEYVEVVDGKLKRTVLVEGKRQTFTYNRCPAG